MAKPLQMKRITVDILKKEIGVTDDQLNQRCTEEHLSEVAPFVGSYTIFTSRFQISPAHLNDIKTNLQTSHQQKTEAVFKWWLENMYPATYRSFIEVCIEIGEGIIARKMCQLLCPAGPSTSDPVPISKTPEQQFSPKSLDNGRAISSSFLDGDHPSSPKPRSNSVPDSSSSEIPLAIQHMSWKKCETSAPDNFLRPIDCVAHGDTAYFRNFSTSIVYSYKIRTGEWDRLPVDCVADTSLVFLPVTCQGSPKFHLHTIGGRKLMKQRKTKRDEFTGAVYQLCNIDEDGPLSWKVANYPPLNYKRSQVTVAYSDSYIIAAGGCSEYGVVNKVEVLNILTDKKEWFDVDSLPQPVFRASACVCSGLLYILGDHVHDPNHGLIATNAAYVASIENLVDSLDQNVFTPIASLRLKESAFVAFQYQVVAIGGWKSTGTTSSGRSAVHVYDKEKNKWVKLANELNEPRCQSFAAAFRDKIMAVGGYENPCGLRTNSVEFATFLPPLGKKV